MQRNGGKSPLGRFRDPHQDSAGVTVVTDPDGAAGAWRVAARSPRGMYGLPPDPRVLVQDYVEGTEYSVESITQHGTTTHLCVTRKAVTQGAHRVEVGRSLPADLPPGTGRAMHQEAERAIAAVGIRNGASHTEVIVGGDGWCSASRSGPASVPDTSAFSCGTRWESTGGRYSWTPPSAAPRTSLRPAACTRAYGS
ncbi:ATP-grasp domain-containing protein [Streptomyces sp. NPDC055078]